MSGEVPSVEEFERLADKIREYDSDSTQPVEAIDIPMENFYRIYKKIEENRELPKQDTSMCPCHSTNATHAVDVRIQKFKTIYNELINHLKSSTKGTSDNVKKLLDN